MQTYKCPECRVVLDRDINVFRPACSNSLCISDIQQVGLLRANLLLDHFLGSGTFNGQKSRR